MSRATQQSLILLSSFAGCLGNLMAVNAYARVDIKAHINSCFDTTCLVIKYWPSDKSESVRDATHKIQAWATMMGVRQENIPAQVLIYMASRILADLEDKVKSREKRELLGRVRKAFQPIEDFVDPEKANFLAFEEGDKMLDKLNKLIEWEA